MVWELKATIPSRGPLENQMERLDAMKAPPLLLLGVTLKHGADLLASGALALGPTQSSWRARGLLHAPIAWGSCLVREWEGMR